MSHVQQVFGAVVPTHNNDSKNEEMVLDMGDISESTTMLVPE